MNIPSISIKQLLEAGVHLGHKKILQTIVEKARINKWKSIIVTFWPHPKMILNKKDNFKLLSTLEEKIKIFDEIKIDYLYIIDFSSNFSKTKADDFIKDTLLKKLIESNSYSLMP